MAELKPCPFCGGEAVMATKKHCGGYMATIYCRSDAQVGCFVQSNHWALQKDWAEKSATEAWNRRAGE